jgi:hypothetical protein
MSPQQASEQVVTLLEENRRYFLYMSAGPLTQEIHEATKIEYLQNHQKIKDMIGLTSRNEYLKYLEDHASNKEAVSGFFDTVKLDLDDIVNPTVDKVYKMRPDGTAEVSLEKVTNPIPVTEEIKDHPYTRTEWETAILSHKNTSINLIFDNDIISVAKQFMVGPLTAYQNKAILAETESFHSLQELKDWVLTESQTKDMILYMVLDTDVTDFGGRDPFSYTAAELAALPKKKKYMWRGKLVDRV